MARPRKPLDVWKQSDLVEARLRTEPAGPARERLRAVHLGLLGEMDLDEIAETVGRARSIIQTWFNHYREGGIEGLLKVRRGKGPPSLLTPALAEVLQEGLVKGQWRTAKEAHQVLVEHGLEVVEGSVYHYLGKLGARLRVPRPTHLKKDPVATEAFKERLAEHLTALKIAPGQPVRLWVMDEMRSGLHTVARRVWGLSGVRPVVTVQQKYEWQYVYGALEVGGNNAAHCWYAPTVDLEHNKGFLAELATSDPTSIHVIIYDGAGFHHRDGHPDLPPNLRIINLPPYSPELNPVEKLWDILRDAICNRIFSTIEELQVALTAKLRTYWEDAGNVRRLLGNGWLLAQANDIGLSVLPM